MEELVPKLMTLGEVQKVLQQLLREQVSIRDLGTILETMVETAAVDQILSLLVEASGKRSDGPWSGHCWTTRELKVVTLDRAIEEECHACRERAVW